MTKAWAGQLAGSIDLGFLQFILHENHGAVLGSFSELPKLLRVVFFSTSGAFIVCIYAVLQYMIQQRALILRLGLSCLVSGILGNVADRMSRGYVVDFVAFGPGPVFNLADGFQVLGYFLILWGTFQESSAFWPEQNFRKQFWVDRWFQLKYALFLCTTGLALAMVSLVFSYAYLQVALTEFVGQNQPLIDRFLIPFVLTYLMITILFCGALFVLGMHLSKRMVGPLVAFDRFVNQVLESKTVTPLRLRAGDEFKRLEKLALKIQEKLQKKLGE